MTPPAMAPSMFVFSQLEGRSSRITRQRGLIAAACQLGWDRMDVSTSKTGRDMNSGQRT